MFNFETPHVNEEFVRIKATGAHFVRGLYQVRDESIATLTDPDENYFQLLSRMGP